MNHGHPSRASAVALLLALGASALLIRPASRLGAIPRPQDADEVTKRALIVAIADYPTPPPGGEPYYPDLNAHNDVPLIETALRVQGFDSADIHVLRDADATSDGIVHAIRTRLIGPARAGDIVVFHYSGHGHQLTDDGTDEEDGYDEVLAPYGAPAVLRDGYTGGLHVRDDQLNELFRDLRARIGPEGNLMVSIDACYSGSVTRAVYEGAVRGIAEPIGPPAPSAAGSPSPDGGGLVDREGATTRSGRERDEDHLAPYVVFSAARHDEVSRETRDRERGNIPVGSLSLALGRALAGAGPGTTYGAIFTLVKEHMSSTVPTQTPQLEGDADIEIFSGRAVAQQPFLSVDRVRSDGAVIVNGGTVIGILPGTKIAFHATGTGDPSAADALATGTVEESNVSQALVRLESAPAGPDLEISWAFVTELAPGDLTVRLAFGESIDPALRDRLTEGVGELSILEIGDADPDLVLDLVRSPEGDSGLALIRAVDDKRISDLWDPSRAGFVADVHEQIIRHARSSYLRRMTLEDPAFDVRLELVPADGRLDFADNLLSCDAIGADGYLTEGNQWRFAIGEFYKLILHNEGERDAHVAVLDLMEDGEIGQLYPDPSFRGADNLLAAGSSFAIEDACFEVTEPVGIEVLKLIATAERVDFWPLLTRTRSLSTPDNPFARLFSDVMSGTRSDGRIPAGTGSTHAITIRVVREK